ncbi:MAG: hypothetical protein UW89_C0004G0010 [Parcubacteria group bacterium GW2011_GWB1_45_10]|nr:MAG: hypothetical protein UW89_C0004G0010 [Parcubacteria group bacterium GW2011_GWB1_45_10]
MSLEKPKKRIQPQVIIVPYGPSCVGKTTVMKVFAKKLPLVRIANDELRILLRRRGFDVDFIEALLERRHLLEKVAVYLLKQKLSLVIDANFASSSEHLAWAKKLIKKFNLRLFLIRVVAPKKFVITKLNNKKWLSLKRGGLLATRQEAVEHFLRSSKQYNYERLMPQTFLVVDSSKPIAKQVKKLVEKIRKEFTFY